MSVFISQCRNDGHWLVQPAAAIPPSLTFFYCAGDFGGAVIALDATQPALLDEECLGTAQVQNQQLVLPSKVIAKLDAFCENEIVWLQISIGWELMTQSQFHEVAITHLKVDA